MGKPALIPALQPLFDVLPLEAAMPELLPRGPADARILEIAEQVEKELSSDALKAGLWLYVDDLNRSHNYSQSIHDSIGSFWHGIMHRREGDFSNSKYWFRMAGPSPIRFEGYSPSGFVDQVAAANGVNPTELLQRQRQEWYALFSLGIQMGIPDQ